jgi:hypothetical protein
MAGMHLIVRPHLKGCQSLAADRLLANDNLIASAFRKHSGQMKRVFSELRPEELRGSKWRLRKSASALPR